MEKKSLLLTEAPEGVLKVSHKLAGKQAGTTSDLQGFTKNIFSTEFVDKENPATVVFLDLSKLSDKSFKILFHSRGKTIYNIKVKLSESLTG